MSRNATRTLWQVSLTEGRWSDLREWEGLFTSERAARAFAKRAEACIRSRYLDVDVEPVEAYTTATSAVYDCWPFQEEMIP